MSSTGLKAIREKITFSALAKTLKITRGAISQWKEKIPAERVLAIERITGISRYELRPDLYPLPEGAPCPSGISRPLCGGGGGCVDCSGSDADGVSGDDGGVCGGDIGKEF